MSSAPQNDVEAPSSAVPPVSAPDRRDSSRVTRMGKPVVHRGADAPALDRRVAGAMVAGYQQQHAIASVDGSFERAVNRLPCLVEVHAVQVERPIRFDGA